MFLVYTIVNALTIGLIGFGPGAGAGPGDVHYRVLYLLLGALLWEFLSVLFHEVSESISWERWEGTIEYTFMAPIHRVTHLFGMCLYATIYGSVRTVVVLLVVAFFFDINLGAANIAGALLILAASSLSFIGLGLMAAILPLMSPERGSQATHIFQAVVLLVSGVYYPVSVLPGWLQKLSAFSPATYTLEASRMAILEGAPTSGLLGYVQILLLIGVILIPLGLAAFSVAENHAMRVGKLKRSG